MNNEVLEINTVINMYFRANIDSISFLEHSTFDDGDIHTVIVDNRYEVLFC